MAVPARTPARRRGRWLVGLASLIVGVATVEIGLRVAGIGIAPRGDGPQLHLTRTLPATEAPGLPYLLTPGARAVAHYPGGPGESDRTVRYDVNERGFRGSSAALTRTRGVPRVAVFGDSFTFGTGVDVEDTFPALMEQHWSGAGRPVEVLNLGVFAYNARQLAYSLAYWQPKLEPDIALFVLYINDASGFGVPATPRTETDWRSEWIGRLGLTSGVWGPNDPKSPAQARLMAVRERSRLIDVAAHHLYRRWIAAMAERNYRADWRVGSPGWLTVRESLAAAATFARARGVTLHVAMYPDLKSLGPPYVFQEEHDAAAAICADLGVPFHDLTDVFEGRAGRSLVAHAHDHHPNGMANRLVAARLVECLEPALSELNESVEFAVR